MTRSICDILVASSLFGYTFFYKQLDFQVEPRVPNKMSKMSLKIAMKLLSIFEIDNKVAYILKKNHKFGKISDSSFKVSENYQFEIRELLTTCYDFRKSEPRRVQKCVVAKYLITSYSIENARIFIFIFIFL